MTFPASVDTVTLTVGPLYDAGGLPRRGVPLSARLPRRVVILESGAVLATTVTDRTDDTGVASLTLVATDSAGVDSTGWTYRVTCPGVVDPPGVDVALPAAAPAVAVETLVAAAASDGEIVSLPLIATDAAVAGLVADSDSDTRAALEALPTRGRGGRPRPARGSSRPNSPGNARPGPRRPSWVAGAVGAFGVRRRRAWRGAASRPGPGRRSAW